MNPTMVRELLSCLEVQNFGAEMPFFDENYNRFRIDHCMAGLY
jgi:hypothetical protein